jgi:hypothetical protein
MAKKIEYESKQDALFKLRYLQKNPHGKKVPVRIYYDDKVGKWQMTSREEKFLKPPTLIELLELVFGYVEDVGAEEDRLKLKRFRKYMQLSCNKKSN